MSSNFIGIGTNPSSVSAWLTFAIKIILWELVWGWSKTVVDGSCLLVQIWSFLLAEGWRQRCWLAGALAGLAGGESTQGGFSLLSSPLALQLLSTARRELTACLMGNLQPAQHGCGLEQGAGRLPGWISEDELSRSVSENPTAQLLERGERVVFRVPVS